MGGLAGLRRLMGVLIWLWGLAPVAAAEPPLTAIASIFPVADLVQQIGGERWQVLTLLPAGASAHTYEPTPEQVRQMAQAKLFFQIGLHLEFWLEKLVQAAKNPGLVSVDLSQHIDTLPMPAPELPGMEDRPRHGHSHPHSRASGQSEHTPDQQAPDPHYWLDPVRMIEVVQRIKAALTSLDGDHAAGYAERAERVRDSLEQLDAESQQRTSGLQNRRFVALHAAWTYFAPRYHLEQVAVIEPFPGREPSPRYLAGLAQLMRREHVQAVVIEPQLSATAARALARETGARVGLLDPYGGPGVPGRESYVALMRHNIAALVTLLE